jgi:iron-sulfur cluster assembly protein
MTTTTAPSPAPRRALPPLMRLSDAAAERLRALYAKPGAKKFIRIAVRTKGCSGLAYDLSFVDEAGPGDEVVTDQGLTLLVDRKASLFLFGTVMDFRREQFSEGFSFVNPNEKGRCGCGESFHV